MHEHDYAKMLAWLAELHCFVQIAQPRPGSSQAQSQTPASRPASQSLCDIQSFGFQLHPASPSGKAYAVKSNTREEQLIRGNNDISSTSHFSSSATLTQGGASQRPPITRPNATSSIESLADLQANDRSGVNASGFLLPNPTSHVSGAAAAQLVYPNFSNFQSTPMQEFHLPPHRAARPQPVQNLHDVLPPQRKLPFEGKHVPSLRPNSFNGFRRDTTHAARPSSSSSLLSPLPLPNFVPAHAKQDTTVVRGIPTPSRSGTAKRKTVADDIDTRRQESIVFDCQPREATHSSKKLRAKPDTSQTLHENQVGHSEEAATDPVVQTQAGIAAHHNEAAKKQPASALPTPFVNNPPPTNPHQATTTKPTRTATTALPSPPPEATAPLLTTHSTDAFLDTFLALSPASRRSNVCSLFAQLVNDDKFLELCDTIGQDWHTFVVPKKSRQTSSGQEESVVRG